MTRDSVIEIISNLFYRSGQVTTGTCDPLAKKTLETLEGLEILKPLTEAEEVEDAT